jgi:mannose-6-phosphate isomerase-like protein (cupin superfamily)
MAGNYTVVNFDSDVENLAPQFGMEGLDARFARETLELQNSGVSRMRVEGNVRTPFGHKHAEQEEVYVVTKGSARVKLDDEIVELKQWDAVRVPPGSWRGYEAGPEGLEILVVGAPNLGDDPREDVDGRRDWWAD